MCTALAYVSAAAHPVPCRGMSPAIGSLEKALRFGEGRRLKRLQEQAAYIATLEPDFQKLSDEALRAKTVEFRERLPNRGEPRQPPFWRAAPRRPTPPRGSRTAKSSRTSCSGRSPRRARRAFASRTSASSTSR